jgi:dihydrofolate reductase
MERTAPAPVAIIVARARNGVIGRAGALPWHLPADLAHFKRTTLGHPVVMGRRTWESIGRALPGRRNLVVSRTPGFEAAGAEVRARLADALAACAGESEVFVIGGAQLYAEALALAQRAYVTEIDADVPGDTQLAALDPGIWREAERGTTQVSPEGLRYTFVRYERT